MKKTENNQKILRWINNIAELTQIFSGFAQEEELTNKA
jgi:hypothetical protein